MQCFWILIHGFNFNLIQNPYFKEDNVFSEFIYLHWTENLFSKSINEKLVSKSKCDHCNFILRK